jgi:hypothetical protein
MVERNETGRKLFSDSQYKNFLGFVFVLILVPMLGLFIWGLILLGIYVYSLGALACIVACVIVVVIFLVALYIIFEEKHE